ncbi:His Kinase A (phospho-acceptor) domain-containing protein [Pedobacter sp. ok626]|uniref:ATP-binding protein n=1 Tax=Pedobacter sp. ok626 TaxID=1761882 RepID=UPI00088A6342|nr:ATP-binding protein [Pedobacter sp. ok626]SDI98751.1 His Kinase A (phospho-acceptor) domain-containing protein [Pedobacter sp. ok626]
MTNFYRTTFLFMLLFLNSHELFAQSPFKSLTINNGLPHTDALGTVQDSKGFLWIATFDGLCRYDGTDIVVFRSEHLNPNSLSNNRILSLAYDDKRSGLWIATQSGGLNFLNLISGQFTRLPVGPKNSVITEKFCVKLFGDELWVGTGHGLYVADLSRGVTKELIIKPVLLPNESIVNYIHQDTKKGTWIATPGGIYYKAPEQLRFNRINSSPITAVNTITSFDDDHLIAGTAFGLYKIAISDFSAQKLSDLNVTALLKDGGDKIWAGTSAQGVYVLNSVGNVLDHYIFGNNLEQKQAVVKDIYKDRFSSIFISMPSEGVRILNSSSSTFKPYPRGVSSAEFAKLKYPLCFFTDHKDYLLIGTRGSLLVVYDRNTERYHFTSVNRSIKGNVATDVTAVFKEPKGGIWAGTGDGIFYAVNGTYQDLINGKTKFERIGGVSFKYKVNCIIPDKKGRTWVATSGGLFCYDENRHLVYNSNDYQDNSTKISNSFVNDVVLKTEKNGNQLIIWAATRRGLNRLHFDNNSLKLKNVFHLVADSNLLGVHSDWISLIHYDKKGNLWLGTIGGGLSRLTGSDGDRFHFKTLTTADGLLTNDIETLLEDDEGNFWIGGFGLTKFNPLKGSFQYFDSNDGLQSNSIKLGSSFKSKTGEFIFGGINGFNFFYPNAINRQLVISQPVLTRLIINNITIKPGDVVNGDVILENSLEYSGKIELNHTIKNFGLEFTSVHSHDFEKITYKYRLMGFEKDFVYSGSLKRSVNYTGLPAGKYVFELYASGGNGVWSKTPTTLEIIMLPSFWNSKGGYVLYLTVIGLIFFLQWRRALKKIEIRHKAALKRNEQEQEIKLYEDKMDFFTIVSHELRTPLTLIITPLEQLVNRKDIPKAILPSLEIAQTNASRLKSLIDQVLDFRKIENGKFILHKESVDLDEFLRSTFIQFTDLIREKELIYKIAVDTQSYYRLDPFKMEQVLLNLISNAIKFSKPKGRIELRADRVNKEIIISIANTGSYLDENQKNKIFDPFYQAEDNSNTGTGLGLTISKELVELHGGNIEVKSINGSLSEDTTTTFTIRLPLQEQYAVENLSVNGQLDKDRSLTKLVIVEDNNELRTLLKNEFLNDYCVFEAENGQEGLKLIRKVKPAIILTDIMMPQLDGLQLCKMLKSDISTSDIPVLMITARDSGQNKIEGLEAMADDYLVKPFNLKELHLKVSNLVKQRELQKVKLSNDAALKPAVLQVEPRDEKILKNLIAIIEQDIDNPDFSVEKLSQKSGMSRPALYRKIKGLTGMSIQVFILDIRLKRAAQLLSTKGPNVSEVMYQTGFTSASYFNRAFKNKFGVNPKNYLKH